jgi:23S rRNA (cytidine1920-2'-O)/16S rRNA (cytidine1409-2'-O)-methyltransferase
LPAVQGWLAPGAQVVALVKPQFEAGPARVGKGGVVRDPTVHRDVLAEIAAWAAGNGWQIRGLMRSPIEGAAGNEEFLMWLEPNVPRAGDQKGGVPAAALIERALLS